MGIISSGVRNESDAALALLTDYLDDSAVNVSTGVRTASAMGLGELQTVAAVIAYVCVFPIHAPVNVCL